MTCRVCGRPLDSTPGNMSRSVCWREALPPKDGDYWNERDARECYAIGYDRLLAAQPASAPALIAELADARRALREATVTLDRILSWLAVSNDSNALEAQRIARAFLDRRPEGT